MTASLILVIIAGLHSVCDGKMRENLPQVNSHASRLDVVLKNKYCNLKITAPTIICLHPDALRCFQIALFDASLLRSLCVIYLV